MLRAPPVLNRREAEPRRAAILILAVHGVAGGQGLVGIPGLDQDSRCMHPLLIPEAVHVVTEVIGDVGKRA